MILFQVQFSEEKAVKNGKNASELMEYVTRTLAKEQTTVQISDSVWRDDSEDALCIFGDMIHEICEDDSLFYSLESMSWNIDGVVEDNIQCELNWRKRHRKP